LKSKRAVSLAPILYTVNRLRGMVTTRGKVIHPFAWVRDDLLERSRSCQFVLKSPVIVLFKVSDFIFEFQISSFRMRTQVRHSCHNCQRLLD